MEKEQQVATWMFMMLTALREHFGVRQVDFLPLVKKYRLVHFLTGQYELLHYYDNEYIINDIIKYIEEQSDGDKGEIR